jgi:hypothetical protein
VSRPWTTLLTAIVKHPTPTGSRFSLGGDADQNAVVHAVAAEYGRLTGRDAVTQKRLLEMSGERATILGSIEGSFGHRELACLSGTLHDLDGRPAIVPKGNRSRGYDLSGVARGGRLLDVELGYSGGLALAERVATVRAELPNLRPLTRDRLQQLPVEGAECALAIFGTYLLLGEQVPGVIWLCHSYDPEFDIVDLVLVVRPEHGTSEHGSAYGRDLLSMQVGEAPAFQGIPFGDALALTDQPYEAALRLLTLTGEPFDGADRGCRHGATPQQEQGGIDMPDQHSAPTVGDLIDYLTQIPSDTPVYLDDDSFAESAAAGDFVSLSFALSEMAGE